MDLANQERDARLSKLAGVAFILLYAASILISLELQRRADRDPFGDPPWYFIRHDAIHGLVFLPLAIACVVTILVAMRRKYPQTARNLFGVGLFAFQPVWQLLLIYLNTENLFDRATASTSWTTFDSYLEDPWRWGWLLIGLIPLLILRLRPKTVSP